MPFCKAKKSRRRRPAFSLPDPRELNPLQLAYVGDTLHDLYVRSMLVAKKMSVGAMHRQAVKMVSAAAQAAMLTAIEDELTEQEADMTRRGRNAQAKHAAPKHARPGGLCARDGAGGAVGLSLCDGPDTAPRRTDYPCDCAHGGTMAQAKLKVILLRATPDPDELVALGARLCYAKADLDALQQRVESGDQRAFVERVMQRGHLSVTEHANFTFAVEGVSRALLAQLTRHRLASFSVQSQRYVSMAEGFDYVIPPAIEALGEDAKQEFIRQMETMQAWYCDWQEKLGGAGESANEDARFVLPNAAATRLVMTMNARELMHFFALRCCNRGSVGNPRNSVADAGTV